MAAAWRARAPVAVSFRRAKRLEPRTKLLGEELWLLPSGEVSALLHLVVVDEIWIGSLRPVPGRLVEFVGENAHSGRDFDPLRTEKGDLVLPRKTSRRDPRI